MSQLKDNKLPGEESHQAMEVTTSSQPPVGDDLLKYANLNYKLIIQIIIITYCLYNYKEQI